LEQVLDTFNTFIAVSSDHKHLVNSAKLGK
jgi:hypothetical protein